MEVNEDMKINIEVKELEKQRWRRKGGKGGEKTKERRMERR